jgi:hypothetical protein
VLAHQLLLLLLGLQEFESQKDRRRVDKSFGALNLHWANSENAQNYVNSRAEDDENSRIFI